jgi:hypothetical protein
MQGRKDSIYRGRGISTCPEPSVFRLGDRSIPMIRIAGVFVNSQRYREIGSISSVTNKLMYTVNMFPSTTLVLFDPSKDNGAMSSSRSPGHPLGVTRSYRRS